MKFATVSGVCFSKRVQRILPAVVSITATGLPDALGAAVAALGGVVLFLVAVCASSAVAIKIQTAMITRDLGIQSLLDIEMLPKTRKCTTLDVSYTYSAGCELAVRGCLVPRRGGHVTGSRLEFS